MNAPEVSQLKFTFYPPGVKNLSVRGIDTTLEKIIEGIRSGKWGHQVAAVRQAFETGGKAAAKPLKNRLPGVSSPSDLA
jgi:hypothetical protein